MSRKITPFLWFNNNAEEAMTFYLSVFADAEVLNVHRLPGSPDGGQGPVITANFRLLGQEFMALNGGPVYQFSEAISFLVGCKNQEEVDELWEKLTDGGSEGQCGWLKDKFGLSWQIIPHRLGELLGGADPAGAGRAMQAMMQMKKIIVADLEAAYSGA